MKCKGVGCCVVAAWHCPYSLLLCGYPHGSINYLHFYNALLNWFYLYRESVFNVNVNSETPVMNICYRIDHILHFSI